MSQTLEALKRIERRAHTRCAELPVIDSPSAKPDISASVTSQALPVSQAASKPTTPGATASLSSGAANSVEPANRGVPVLDSAGPLKAPKPATEPPPLPEPSPVTAPGVPRSAGSTMQPGRRDTIPFSSAGSLMASKPTPTPREVVWPCRPVPKSNYENLATHLLSQQAASRPAAVMFTSPGDGDGKTDLLLSFAPLLAAQAQRRVLLVDADFCKGDLGDRLSAFNGGLNSLLSDESTLAEVVCPTTIPQLSFLPQGVRAEADDSRSNLSALDSVLDDLKCGYSLVLLDAPSLAHRHVARMSAYCDGVCLVVRSGYTSRLAIQRATQVLENVGGRLWGCVVIGE